MNHILDQFISEFGEDGAIHQFPYVLSDMSDHHDGDNCSFYFEMDDKHWELEYKARMEYSCNDLFEEMGGDWSTRDEWRSGDFKASRDNYEVELTEVTPVEVINIEYEYVEIDGGERHKRR